MVKPSQNVQDGGNGFGGTPNNSDPMESQGKLR